MTKQLKMMNKQSLAFANSKKMTSNAQQRATKLVKPFPTNKNSENIDKLLENTLTNNIEVTNPLTRREKEILLLIISGKTNKQIAKSLYRTQRTVEYHRNRIMCKLNAHNTVDLVKKTIAMGIA